MIGYIEAGRNGAVNTAPTLTIPTLERLQMAERKHNLFGRRSHGRTPPDTPTIKQRWQAAKAAGERTFDPGVECANGHTSFRWANNGICIDCKRARDTAYNAAHKEQHRARSKRSAEPRKAELKIYIREWMAKNAHRMRANLNRRKARKVGAVSGDPIAYLIFTKWAKTASSVPCYWCRVQTKPGNRRHIDHIIPLSRGGADAVGNLCISCADCNHAKHAKMPEEFSGQSELGLA